MAIPILDGYGYGLSAIVTIIMQLSFFAVAYGCGFDLVTDFAGSTNYILIALLILFLSGGPYETRQTVLTSLICISRMYLALFLLLRVCKRKKDARFDEVRSKFWKFLAFWVFQMFWAFTGSMPAIYLNSRNSDQISASVNPLGLFDYLGWLLMIVGIVLQIVADYQKYQFRSNPSNSAEFCRVGAWSYSRHPNYFGEMLIWVGAFVCVLGSLSAATTSSTSEVVAALVTIVCPLFSIVILVFGSGLPTAEGNNLKRYYDSGKGNEWEAYAAMTSPIIPMPPTIYLAIPQLIKKWCLCELSFLKYHGPAVYDEVGDGV